MIDAQVDARTTTITITITTTITTITITTMSSPTPPQHQYRRGVPHLGPTGRELLGDSLRRKADELGPAVNVIGHQVATMLILRPLGGAL